MALLLGFSRLFWILVVSKILFSNSGILVPRKPQFCQSFIPGIDFAIAILNGSKFLALRVTPGADDSVKGLDGSNIGADNKVDGFAGRNNLVLEDCSRLAGLFPSEIRQGHGIVGDFCIIGFVHVSHALTMADQHQLFWHNLGVVFRSESPVAIFDISIVVKTGAVAVAVAAAAEIRRFGGNRNSVCILAAPIHVIRFILDKAFCQHAIKSLKLSHSMVCTFFRLVLFAAAASTCTLSTVTSPSSARADGKPIQIHRFIRKRWTKQIFVSFSFFCSKSSIYF
mmetsp:Transcript_3659/g.7621  ORF Transcript_3659/g.7621 Transcript_3659/m.7621 type:complete len:282 (+) Transcript_3659:510-1355(+)